MKSTHFEDNKKILHEYIFNYRTPLKITYKSITKKDYVGLKKFKLLN